MALGAISAFFAHGTGFWPAHTHALAVHGRDRYIWAAGRIIASQEAQKSALFSIQMVILRRLGKPFMAASPQNRLPSGRSREMESSVCPGVSRMRPPRAISNASRFSAVTATNRSSSDASRGGKRCSPWPRSFIRRQNPNAKRLVQPPAKEFCPRRSPASAALCATTFARGAARSASFK